MKKLIITLLMILASLTSTAYSFGPGLFLGTLNTLKAELWANTAIKEAKSHGSKQVSSAKSKVKKLILDTQKLQEKYRKKNNAYQVSLTKESGPVNRKGLKDFKVIATQIDRTRSELDSLPQSQCSRFDSINYDSDLLNEKESCKLIYVAILKCKAKKSKNKEIQFSLEDRYPSTEANCYEI